MRRLGTVLHTTPNGYIVVKLEEQQPPPLNVRVYDRDLRPIGVLLDIIGPVKEPYAVVKPASREIKLASGEVVYYKPPRPQKRGRRPRKTRTPRQHRGRQAGRRGGGGGRGRGGRRR
ncbi:H/ACA ribonucleoprotein complex subunit GAR1 [Hyperthermus butylicus]|uniref:RNA binding protein, Gar1-type n=1 Tax=Hyperthermus butylicus (strain DSM 5456 / JCM 9403 / PLM1-5) TaxID=415426 RepID=A2BK12_HYPBU|nr:Gar1/Naf1 family protein [Hyperthermus butylicus]ABM80323.1 RNA binding protein, Gar1-type [Hyperthermus butylicus DSM 5456]